jgi:hypothetical protein
MAVNFGILAQTPSIGARYMEGMQMRQADAERNMLRQAQVEQMAMQRENMLAQRENMLAQRGERQAMAADREEQARARRAAAVRQAEADEYLGKVSALFEQNNTPLNMATARQGLAFAIKSRDPNAIQMMTKTVQALEEKESYAAEAARLGLPGAAAPVAPANALAAPPAAAAPTGITREMAQQMILSPDPRIREQGKALLPSLPKELTPRASQLLTPEEEAQKTRIALASRPPPQPREPREPPAPIPVVDPATGQVKYAPREQAVGMTPPQFMESLTPKERQKREALFPKAKQAVATVETTMGDLVADLENLAAHPGLTGITGVVYGRTPSVTPQAREAQALYDKIVARGGFSELQNMRAASPTGGALGNVSNQEGAQLKQAFAEIGREQATESVKKALLRAAENAKLVRQRAREAFEDTYEYRQSGGAAHAPASPNIDALLNKYK